MSAVANDTLERLFRLPGATQTFLVQCSILEWLEASLCNAVTGRRDSARQLAQLAGGFLDAPGDGKLKTYRFRPGQATALRRLLAEVLPADIPELHRRASTWLSAHAEHAQAMLHALETDDDAFVLTASLRAFDWQSERNGLPELARIVDAVPRDIVRAFPDASIMAAALRVHAADVRAAQELLTHADGLLQDGVDPALDFTYAELCGMWLCVRAMIHHAAGDAAAATNAAAKALVQLSPYQTQWIRRAREFATAGTARGARIATAADLNGLSLREIEIVQLIASGVSNQAIAEKLFISLGTVKWHCNQIFGKLGVSRRTAAVNAARAAGLI